MAFGILEDHKLDSGVPGTGLLSAKPNHAGIDDAREAKRGAGKHSHIVLIPQPSDDPGDPLNWPRWKKETCFWILILATALEGALNSLAAPGYVVLAKEFHVSVDEIASSFSASSLGLSLFTLVQNTLAFKYGLRLLLLLSTLLMFVSSIWTALSPDLVFIRASRVFQGIGMAAPRSLVPTAIEHIFFVHERGSRMIIWTFSLGAGTTLGPFIYSYVVQYLSWRLGFWFIGIACGLLFVGVFFFVPETTYRRQGATIGPTKLNNKDSDSDSDQHSAEKMARTRGDPDAPCPKPPSFLRQLKIYNGTFSDDSLWTIFLRPFPFVLSPVTWFIFLAASLPSVLSGLISICSTTIFTITYHFNAAQIGLTHLSGLVGTVFAISITTLSDRTIVWMSQRNRGIYEPEYRLVFMVCMLFGVFGYIGWGVGNDQHMSWMGAVICITMTAFSLSVCTGAAVTYLLDTHGANALHILSLTNAAREMVLYGSTFFANGFILSHGVKVSLLVIGACQAVCALACIPMYVYGKRVRSFVARHPRLFRGDLPASTADCATATAAGKALEC